MNTYKIIILTMTLALVGLPASAQKRMQGTFSDEPQKKEREFSDPDQGGPPSDERREELRKRIETIRIWRLTEELKLDANAGAKLASFLGGIEQQRRDIMREQMETMRSLRQSLRSSKPEETKLKTSLDTLEKNHSAMQDLRNKELSGLKNILTVEQLARYLLFQQEFQREMREMIGGARGDGRGKGGMGPGSGQRQGGPREDR